MSQTTPERGQALLPEGGVESSSRPLVSAALVTREEFSAGYDRCFERVYNYVGRHVSDRESCERIVGQVLAENLELLIERREEKHELSRLKAASDRLIGLESEATINAFGPQHPQTR